MYSITLNFGYNNGYQNYNIIYNKFIFYIIKEFICIINIKSIIWNNINYRNIYNCKIYYIKSISSKENHI